MTAVTSRCVLPIYQMVSRARGSKDNSSFITGQVIVADGGVTIAGG